MEVKMKKVIFIRAMAVIITICICSVICFADFSGSVDSDFDEIILFE